jgi:hypothetical protein
MTDRQNTAIVLLLITAVILTGLLVATYWQTDQVAQAQSSSRRGNYIVVSGEYRQGSLDLIYVVNLATRSMNVYHGNDDTMAIELMDRVDLERAFAQ